MKTAILDNTDAKLRDEWLQTVSEFKNQIMPWIDAEDGWSMEEQETREIEEPFVGQYTVIDYKIHTPTGEVRVEPIARNYPNSGILELFAWPTLYRVRLVQADAKSSWRVRTDSGIFLRQEWNQENFITLIRDLVSAAA